MLWIRNFYYLEAKCMSTDTNDQQSINLIITCRDSEVHGANMGPAWVHVGPMNLAIGDRPKVIPPILVGTMHTFWSALVGKWPVLWWVCGNIDLRGLHHIPEVWTRNWNIFFPLHLTIPVFTCTASFLPAVCWPRQQVKYTQQKVLT